MKKVLGMLMLAIMLVGCGKDENFTKWREDNAIAIENMEEKSAEWNRTTSFFGLGSNSLKHVKGAEKLIKGLSSKSTHEKINKEAKKLHKEGAFNTYSLYHDDLFVMDLAGQTKYGVEYFRFIAIYHTDGTLGKWIIISKEDGSISNYGSAEYYREAVSKYVPYSGQFTIDTYESTFRD